MARVAAGEVAFATACIQQSVRLDGRSVEDYRPVDLQLGAVPQAAGSARLHMGATDVLVGVKVEVGTPTYDAPDRGRLHVTVELSPVAAPEFEGRGGEEWGSQLARALESSLRGGGGAGLDLRQLCIATGKHCWHLFVDALVLNDGGNVLDACSIAALAALRSTKIPKVSVVQASAEDEAELELDDDPDACVALEAGSAPVIVSVSQVGSQCVVDLSLQEEACASCTAHVAVNAKGQVCGSSLEGPRGVDTSTLQAMTALAGRVGPRLLAGLDGFVAAHAAAQAGK